MATVLLAWELGGGLGHIMQLWPYAQGLAKRGHRVVVALKDLARARTIFGNTVSYLQAPTRTRPASDQFRPPMTFAHILYGIGFGDFDELVAMGEAWRNLYEMVRPDVVIFDHSPTALLASRGYGVKRIVVGSGFCCPPDSHPAPNLRPWVKADVEKLRQDEATVLARINETMKLWGWPLLDHMTQMYAEADDTFLVTFKELDHYQDRPASKYWGAWAQTSGKAPEWPQGSGPRIYAYLKPFPALPHLLRMLTQLKHPAVVFVDGLDAKLREQFSAPNIHFEQRPLDLKLVSRQCDLAILNAGHGTTVSMLMAGKPILQLPIYLEQGLMARAMCQYGVGMDASPKQPRQIAERLQAMLRSDRYTEAAEQFATRYADFDPQRSIEGMLDRVEELLAQ